jgi:hypothetical protein
LRRTGPGLNFRRERLAHPVSAQKSAKGASATRLAETKFAPPKSMR